jgi:hypothetical protein
MWPVNFCLRFEKVISEFIPIFLIIHDEGCSQTHKKLTTLRTWRSGSGDRTSEHPVTKYCTDDQIKEKKLGKAYSMHTENEKWIENINLGIGTDHLGYLSVDGKMSNRVWAYGLDWTGSVWGSDVGSCEQGNEPCSLIKDGNFIAQMRRLVTSQRLCSLELVITIKSTWRGMEWKRRPRAVSLLWAATTWTWRKGNRHLIT